VVHITEFRQNAKKTTARGTPLTNLFPGEFLEMEWGVDTKRKVEQKKPKKRDGLRRRQRLSN